MNFSAIHQDDSLFVKYWERAVIERKTVHPFYSHYLFSYDHIYLEGILENDDSFVVIDDRKKLVALVPLYRCREKGEAIYGYGAYHMAGPLVMCEETSKQHQQVLEYIALYIEELARANKVSLHRAYYPSPTIQSGDYYSNPLMALGYCAEDATGLVLSIAGDENDVYLRFRKSYRPLINKASRNYECVIVDKDSFDLNICEEYQRLHTLAAGRETRAKRSFEVQYEMIKGGHGFLVLVREGSKYVGAYLFYILKGVAFYASAANHPQSDLKLGSGHLGIWRGIQKARDMGAGILDFGLLGDDGSDQKLKNIEFFKAGFGGRKTIVFRGTRKFN